ncbi:DUF2267 domain-containing protein [Halobaculum sp. MBLA0147]|uniref:DUF2267 domain-containing protein n=1 Tax=Halobaculum sp. MBLA0147 TaxID=3079934 RepID=UPI00352567B1
MDSDEFVTTVQTRLGRSDETTARRVTRAVVVTLAERVAPRERGLLRRVFPTDLLAGTRGPDTEDRREVRLDTEDRTETFDYETFLDRVAERSRPPRTPRDGSGSETTRATAVDGGSTTASTGPIGGHTARTDGRGFTWTRPRVDTTAYRAMVVLEVATDTGSTDDLARLADSLPAAYEDLFILIASVDTLS